MKTCYFAFCLQASGAKDTDEKQGGKSHTGTKSVKSSFGKALLPKQVSWKLLACVQGSLFQE